MIRRVHRALLSVSDKTGLVDFARGLSDLGIELISTGGTSAALAEAGLPIIGISDITHFPEMLDGRVKTLHPAVHGGILADRTKPEHMKAIDEHGITPIDMVVVNLYPFSQVVARPDASWAEAIENIDIGGPSMVRSAAKNHASVAVVVSPDSYPAILDELQNNDVTLSPETLRRLAGTAFAHTAAYDATIARYFATAGGDESTVFPPLLSLTFDKVQDLRYGENPHQKAAFYRESNAVGGVATARKLHGRELSFNNIYDLNAAYNLVAEFAGGSGAAAAIIKHTNPCGLAVAPTLADAFQRARSGDPISAFGGILATSCPIDAATAELITGKNTFFEAIIAPGFDRDAFQILTEKKQWGANLILLEGAAPSQYQPGSLDYKRVSGGMLAQTEDRKPVGRHDLTVVSRRAPSSQEIDELLFAWRAVKHVKSNGIVIAKDRHIVGVGAGQMNRVQSVRLAVTQAGEKARGAVLASDAFFPFADGPEAAGEAGIAAIIQPGGSKKDAETIEMADNYNMAMVFTATRHFRH